MIKKLSHSGNSDGLGYFVSEDGGIGSAYHLDPIDLEDSRAIDSIKMLEDVLLRYRFPGKIRIETDYQSNSKSGWESKRKAPGREFSSRKSTLVFEGSRVLTVIDAVRNLFVRGEKSNSRQVQGLINAPIADFRDCGIGLREFEEREIPQLFSLARHERVVKENFGLRFPNSVVGVLRVEIKNDESQDSEALARCLEAIPLPFSVQTSFEPLNSAAVEGNLRRKIRQSEAIDALNGSADEKRHELRALGDGKERFFKGQCLVLLHRGSEKELLEGLRDAALVLRRYFKVSIESYGAAKTLISTQVGANLHAADTYKIDHLMGLLPVFVRGENRENTTLKRTLPLHRADFSDYQFDLFSGKYDCSNALIVGSSGKGKSVLLGLLTESLMNDSNVRIIKVDVGGSGSRECQRLGGIEHQFDLSNASGLNPFSVFSSDDHSIELCSVISSLLGVLVQEENEPSLSKDMKGQIEALVIKYSANRPKNPSIDDFLEFASDMPRKSLLERFTKGRIFQNVFAEGRKTETNNNRYDYYNFSEISQASNEEFAQAVMAGLIAKLNIEYMKEKKKKICFITDETPFFIKKCGDFFKFTTANVRKYGHASMLISQRLNDFVIGEDDFGIIENSPTRFLFSIDGNAERFKKLLALNDGDLEKIRDLRSVKGRFSEVLLQDSMGSRLLRVSLTPQEYWRLTTTKDDQLKLDELLRNVPGLSMEEGVECLARVTN